MITISTWIIYVWLGLWFVGTVLGLAFTNLAYKAAAGKLYDTVSKMIDQELNKRKEESKKEVEENDA